MTIGALRPANTWDMPAYLALGCVAVFYTVMRHAQAPQIMALVRSVGNFFSEMQAWRAAGSR